MHGFMDLGLDTNLKSSTKGRFTGESRMYVLSKFYFLSFHFKTQGLQIMQFREQNYVRFYHLHRPVRTPTKAAKLTFNF